MTGRARVAGVDRWKGGWVAVVLGPGRTLRAMTFETLAAAGTALDDIAVLGVDIPVGLPAPGVKRRADLLARVAVGARRNSVFFSPARCLLDAATQEEANQLARALGIPGMSSQCFGLKAAILEADAVVRTDDRWMEVHPEVCFWAMNGKKALRWAKTSWGGFHERLRVLAAHGIEVPVDAGTASVVPPADLLDAAAAAWSAARVATGQASRMPDPPEDLGGTLAAITY